MADIEQQALKIIAAECDSFGHPDTATYIRERGKLPEDWRMSAPTVLRLIVAALASQPQAPDPAITAQWDSGALGRSDEHAVVADEQPEAPAVPEGVHKGMADEYQKWIDFFHRGEGDYDDFLRVHVFAAAPAPEVSGG